MEFPWNSHGRIPMARYNSGFSGAKALHTKGWLRRWCAVAGAMIPDAHRLP